MKRQLGKLQVWGNPLHGLVKGGKLWLPETTQPAISGGNYYLANGLQCFWDAAEGRYYLPCEQPHGVVYSEYGRALQLKRPGWTAPSRTAGQLAEDEINGFSWRPESIMSGARGKIYRKDTFGSWVYFASDNSRWLVKITSVAVNSSANNATMAITMVRFGEFGKAPESKNYTIEWEDIGGSFSPLPSGWAIVNDWLLEDCKSDGSVAVFSIRARYVGSDVFWQSGVSSDLKTHQRAASLISLTIDYNSLSSEFSFTPSVHLPYSSVRGSNTLLNNGSQVTYDKIATVVPNEQWVRGLTTTYQRSSSVTDIVLGGFFDDNDVFQVVKVNSESAMSGEGSMTPLPDEAPSWSGSASSTHSGTFSLSLWLNDENLYSVPVTYSAEEHKDFSWAGFVPVGTTIGSVTTSKTWNALGQQVTLETTDVVSVSASTVGTFTIGAGPNPLPGIMPDVQGLSFNAGFSSPVSTYDGWIAFETGSSQLDRQDIIPIILRPSNKLFVIVLGILTTTLNNGASVGSSVEYISAIAVHPAGTTELPGPFDALPVYGSYDPYTQEVAVGTEPMCFV